MDKELLFHLIFIVEFPEFSGAFPRKLPSNLSQFREF